MLKFHFFFCNILKITNPCNHHRWAQTLVKLHFPETDRVNANNHRLHGAEADGRGTSVRFQFDELDTCECDECCFLATAARALLETLTAKSLALQLPLLNFFLVLVFVSFAGQLFLKFLCLWSLGKK